ncbi:protein kinase domain-containing protein [Terrabacter sp. 2RAF25]|uniref:serine/threonine-protein kinase n=1 Tax=Terrabacter sp. 2RAF25 TaxID=3232998 RepID=UPI003F9C941F
MNESASEATPNLHGDIADRRHVPGVHDVPDALDVPDVPGHRLDAVVGAGASAVVWSGVDATGRPVAVKVPHRVRDEVDAHQALVEQQVLTAVHHEHLVPLRSVVPLPDGREALVFDLVRGAVLRAMVGSRGHLRPGEVVTVLTPICEAVAHLHSAGGIHADISPSNITLTGAGRPVLLDLGAARVAGREPGAVHGTPGFVAPEVLLGDAPGDAADVYALGAVAWFCLTGNGAPDTMARLDLETVVSHVGAELAEVIAQAIDPEPERRPGAAELALRFYEAAPAEPVEVVVGADQASALTHRLRADAERDAPGEAVAVGARWRTRLLAAALVAVPALGLAGWALAARQPGPTRPDAVVTTPPAVQSTSTPLRPSSSPATAPAALRTPAAPATSVAPQAASHPTSSARGPAAGSASRSTDELVLDPTSPAQRPEDLLQALSDRRGGALLSLDERALAAVHAPHSASATSDAGLLTRLRDSRVRWEGLRLEVAEASYVSGDEAHAVLRARVDWTAYVVVSGDGARSQRPADTGRLLDFSLARGPQGWRLTDITTAPAT